METNLRIDQSDTDQLLVNLLRVDLQFAHDCGIANKDVYGKRKVHRDTCITMHTEKESAISNDYNSLMKIGEKRQKSMLRRH